MSDIITGARAALLVNGKKIGYATNVRVSQEVMTEPFEPLDTIEVEEHVVTGVRCSVECAFVRITGRPSTKDGMFFTAAQFKAGGPEITLTIQDTVTKKVLYTVVGCKPTGRNTNIPARGMSTKDMTFVGRMLFDEVTNPAEAGS